MTSQKIRALNKKYLNRTYATDVLAFNLTPDIHPKNLSKRDTASPLIGDIFISTDAARQSVKTYGTDLAHELVLYIVHGILHLLGYDDHSPTDTKEMRSAESDLMARLGRSVKSVIEPDP